MNLPLSIAALFAGAVYVYMWIGPTAPHRWRDQLDERGETSLSLVILAVTLVAGIVLLSALSRDVPEVLGHALNGVLLGIFGGEVTVRRVERAAGTPRRVRK